MAGNDGKAGRSWLTDAECKLLPSDDDVRFYREHGWYVSNPLFSDAELDQVLEASERFYAGHRDRILPCELPPSAYWRPAHGDVQRHNDYICYESDLIFRILCKPLIGAVAARLMGVRQLRLWSSTLIYKPARSDEPSNVVPWHMDRHHWEVCTSDEMLTAFVPLHRCDESSGTLTVIDGSHKWTELPAKAGDEPTFHFAERPKDALDAALSETARYNRAQVREVPLVIEKGRVSFHHCRTYHGSGPNVNANPRRVVTVRFQEAGNEWRPFPIRDGGLAAYNHDRLVRTTPQGTPDYADPEFCPVLWTSEEPHVLHG